MNQYKLTEEAQRELADLTHHIAKEASLERALIVYDHFVAAFERLAGMPGIGHVRENLLNPDYRFWSVYSYLIVYRWETVPIQIVAIVHGMRNLEFFFSQRPM